MRAGQPLQIALVAASLQRDAGCCSCGGAQQRHTVGSTLAECSMWLSRLQQKSCTPISSLAIVRSPCPLSPSSLFPLHRYIMSFRSDTRELVWAVVKKNNSTVVRSGNHIKFEFDSSSRNVTGINSKKYNVLCNTGAFSLDVEEGEVAEDADEDAVGPNEVVITTADGETRVAADDFAGVVKAVKAAAASRADLEKMALARWTKLNASLTDAKDSRRTRSGKKAAKHFSHATRGDGKHGHSGHVKQQGGKHNKH